MRTEKSIKDLTPQELLELKDELTDLRDNYNIYELSELINQCTLSLNKNRKDIQIKLLNIYNSIVYNKEAKMLIKISGLDEEQDDFIDDVNNNVDSVYSLKYESLSIDDNSGTVATSIVFMSEEDGPNIYI